MKTISTCIIVFLLGCHSPSPKDSIGHDSTKIHQNLGEEKKADSLAIKYSPYRPFKEFSGDTLTYLKHNFVDRTDYYQNKQLYTLLKDLELAIYRYTPISYNDPHKPYMINKSYGLYLEFENGGNIIHKYSRKKVPNVLIIKYKDTINRKEIALLLKQDQFFWTKKTEIFYKKTLVKDINMTHYNRKSKGDINELKKH